MPLTPEQLALRKTGITASDPAAIAGVSPYRTALQVFRDKTDPGYEDEQTDEMVTGNFLEDPVAQIYQHRTGAFLEKSGTLRHHRLELMLATPDRIATVDGEKRLLEVKTSSAFGARERWGPEGTDAIPEHVNCQVQWTMSVAGLKRADVATLLEGRFALFHVEFDPDFTDAMYELALDFWERYVKPKSPPPPDGSPAWTNYLKEMWPASRTATLLPATFEDVQLVSRYRQGQAMEKEAEELKAQARQLLELRIGDNAGLEGPGWRLWWKSNRMGQHTDWEALARRLGATEEQIQEHTLPRLGNRPFVVRDIKPKGLLSIEAQP